MTLTLRNARVREAGVEVERDVVLAGGRVAAVERPGVLPAAAPEADLEGRLLLPGLVNAHDHLDFSTFPPLGTPPYESVYEWAADVDAGQGHPDAEAALAVPLPDRLFLGGLRNLLAGVTAVAHHNPYHRSLGRSDFPVRVLARYQFAHSPGLTPRLRTTYRTTDRRIPWMIHVAEGTDERCRAELDALVRENVLRQNTVLVHGIALPLEKLAAVAEARACLVWCPESNRRLYGATAPIAAIRGAGVRVGLGSDSPVSGVRDALSNLAVARAEGVMSDDELLALATEGSAEAARLPLGAVHPGAPGDLIAVGSREGLLAGERAAVELVLVAGRACYGDPDLMAALDPRSVLLLVAGTKRRLRAELTRRAGAILRTHPVARLAGWAADLDVG